MHAHAPGSQITNSCQLEVHDLSFSDVGTNGTDQCLMYKEYFWIGGS